MAVVKLPLLLGDERLEQRGGGGVAPDLTVSIAISAPLIIWYKEKGGERRNVDLDKVRGGDQHHACAALNLHLTRLALCVRRLHRRREERTGVTVQVINPVLDACVDDVELEGMDMLEEVRARGRGDSIVASAPKGLVGRFC